MYTLLIDTHSKIINIVLYKDEGIMDHLAKETTKSHSIFVMPLIKQILDENNVAKKDISNLIVVNGPGSFTGIRLGITIAKTWAYTQNIPIKAISSLEVLACSLNTEIKKVAIPDPKGYYIGTFNKDNQKMEEFNYISKEEFTDYKLEDDIQVDYNNVYQYVKNLQPLNPHSVNPVYIKKIEVEK